MLPPTASPTATILSAGANTNVPFAEVSEDGHGVVIYQGKQIYGLPAGQVGASLTAAVITSFAFTDSAGGVYQVMFDEAGRVVRFYIDGYTIQRLGQNEQTGTVDLRIISPDGTFNDFFGVDTDPVAGTARASLRRALSLKAAPLGVLSWNLGCKNTTAPADLTLAELDAWIVRQGTCLSIEAIDTAISPVIDFFVDKVRLVGNPTLTTRVTRMKAAYQRVRDRLLLGNAQVLGDDTSSSTLDAAYRGGIRVTSQPIVVAEPTPAHVKSVVVDLKALAASPDTTAMTVVNKAGIVEPTAAYSAAPVTTSEVLSNDTCLKPGACPDVGASLPAAARDFWRRLNCPLPYTYEASINGRWFIKPSETSRMTTALMDTILAAAKDKTDFVVICNQGPDPMVHRSRTNIFSNFATGQLDSVMRKKGWQLDGEFDLFYPAPQSTSGVVLYQYATYTLGELDGPAAWGDKRTGRTKSAGDYKAGRPSGTWLEYWEDGIVAGDFAVKQRIVYPTAGSYTATTTTWFAKSGAMCPRGVLDSISSPGHGTCLP